MYRFLLTAALLVCVLAPARGSAQAQFDCRTVGGDVERRAEPCGPDEDTVNIVVLSRVTASQLPEKKAPGSKKPASSRRLSDGGATRTKENNLACKTEQWLKDVLDFYAANDTGSFEAYFSSGKCIVMKGDQTVTVLDTTGFLGSRVQFAYKGVKLWTTRSGIDFGL